MKMFISTYLLIIFIKYIVASDDSSSNESKLIDLLPEEEKEEFLKSIARRVFEETQTKDNHHKVSGEIPDDQLNEHSQFVQKILQEETANLRKNGQKNNNENIHESSEILKVKSLDKDKVSIKYEINNSRKDIDLTLHQNTNRKKRDPFRDVTKEKAEHTEHTMVETQFDESLEAVINKSEANKSLPTETNNNLIEKINDNLDETDDEDIQVKNFRQKKKITARDKNFFEYNVTTADNISYFVTTMTNFDETVEVNSEDKNNSLKSIEAKPKVTELVEMINADTELVTVQSEEKNRLESSSKSSKSSKYESQVQKLAELGTTNEYPSTDTTANFGEAKPIANNAPTKIANTDKYHINETRRIIESTIDTETEDYFMATGIVSATENIERKVTDLLNVKGSLAMDDVLQINSIPLDKKNVTINYSEQKNIETNGDGYDKAEITNQYHRKINKIENTAIKNVTQDVLKDDHQFYDLKDGIITNNYIQINDRAFMKDDIEKKNTKINIFLTTFKPITTTTNFKYVETITGLTTEMSISEANNLTAQKIDNFNSRIENSLRGNSSNNYIHIEKQQKKDKENAKKETKLNQEFVNNIIKVLRQGLISENKNNINNDISDADNFKALQSNIKEYSVYETPSNQIPFMLKRNSKKVENNQKNKEQSYYVPIYNYAPNKAYYNANNRLGPNADDPSSEKQNTNSGDNKDIYEKIRDNTIKEELYDKKYFDNKNRKFSFVVRDKYRNEINKESIYKAKPMILVQKKPQYEEFYYNPADYLDVDYYYGRMNSDAPKLMRTIITSKNKQSSILPNSDEVSHPFTNNLKDNIRAVRQVLYQKQRFGFIPAVSYYKESEERDALGHKNYKHYDEMRTRQKNLGNTSKITIPDYYFGATKTDHAINSDFKIVGYIKNLRNTKDIYLSIKDFPRVMKYMKTIQFKTPVEDDSDTGPPVSLSEQLREFDEKIQIVDHDFLKGDNLKNVSYVNNLDDINSFYIPEKRNPEYTKGDIGKIIKLKNINTDGKLTEDLRQVLDAGENIKNRVRTETKIFSRDDIANDNYGDFDTTKEILSVTDESDVFPNLDKLKRLNLSIARTNNISNEIKVYIDVLNDMFVGDSKALKQYDWLGTTVDIQAAFNKLFNLTQLFQNGEKMHPSDFQLLKYNIYLLKTADQLIVNHDIKGDEDIIARNVIKLPRSKKRRKKYLDKFSLNNGWFLKRESSQEGVASEEEVDVDNFSYFLNDLQESLYDLHDAIKHIAMVTKYKRQNWFENLKEIYIKFDKKQLVDIILHLSTSRLFDLIEESAQNGLEADYEEYIKNNEEVVEKSLEELTFVLKILHVIKK